MIQITLNHYHRNVACKIVSCMYSIQNVKAATTISNNWMFLYSGVNNSNKQLLSS
jgi:hypothetical protein